MTAPALYSAEYSTYRRQVRIATLRLRLAGNGPDLDTSGIEALVADVRDSLAATTRCTDGTRSGQLRSWAPLLCRVTNAALDAAGFEVAA